MMFCQLNHSCPTSLSHTPIIDIKISFSEFSSSSNVYSRIGVLGTAGQLGHGTALT